MHVVQTFSEMALCRIGFLTNKTFHKKLLQNCSTNDWTYNLIQPIYVCRKLSNTPTEINTTRLKPLMLKDNPEFDTFFPNIVKDLIDCSELPVCEVKERYAKILSYNVPHGNLYRGLTVVDTYKLLETPENLSQENIKLSWILGWCTELLQSSLLVIDDIIDKSLTRRGYPCWYKLEDIGLNAANDAQILHSSIFVLLKKNISTLPYYVPVLELFHEVMSLTCKGQALELLTKTEAFGLDAFTMKRYNTIVKYKTMYMLKLPLSAAMYMAGKFDKDLHNYGDDILRELGDFCQIQNDMEDCYGGDEMTGKIGNDISEGKCTWLAVKALQKASLDQRKVLETNIGVPTEMAVDAVKRIYEELDIQKDFAEFKEYNLKKIQTHLRRNFDDVPQSIFIEIMNKMYRKDVFNSFMS